MDVNDLEFLKRLKVTFRGEAEEHIRTISAGLIELEKEESPDRRAELMETVFRESHSFKGAARSVGLKDIESICQALEGAFSALRGGSIGPSPSLFDLFHRGVDAIVRIVSSANMEGSDADRAEARRIGKELKEASAGGAPTKKSAEGKVRPRDATEDRSASASTVRIPMERLDALLLQAEEMIAIKMTTGQRIAEMSEIQRNLREWRKESIRRKDRDGTDLDALENQVAAVTRALEQDHRSIRRMVDEHLEGMKRAVMLPVSSLVESFPKIVRDIARDQGKEVELVLLGTDIESDKRILEELKDPLIHLVRNCVDHGIRSPEERVAQGKSPQGTITIAFAAKDSRDMEILVSDDGVGVDGVRVRAAAVKSGILSREAAEKLDEEAVLALIFQSGISTSPILTDISGRGLGLAIVREKVQKLGGSVSVNSRIHAGTAFRIVLPLTLATFRGILVRVDERAFLLPTINVERVLRASQAEIKSVENREMIQVDGQNLSLVDLADVLGLPRRARQAPSTGLFIAVLAYGDRRVAFHVDEILDELQVILKNLGPQLRRVRNVAGAAILGNGKVVPVLNASDLITSAPRAAAAPRSVEPALPRIAHILVAEDSITARSLLKNILEGSGYRVTTAVDGADAYSQAREGEFDLVVSDVDMPRMSGFELTAKIRGDKRLSRTPVVLVTALESREDRERGIDAGADAYIVKSSFDQSNLLDALRRLL
ncbi:MAG: response regulator [Rectinemataceae bacterium]|jgi:two-component system chemotaxis sensor kinase CheA